MLREEEDEGVPIGLDAVVAVVVVGIVASAAAGDHGMMHSDHVAAELEGRETHPIEIAVEVGIVSVGDMMNGGGIAKVVFDTMKAGETVSAVLDMMKAREIVSAAFDMMKVVIANARAQATGIVTFPAAMA